MLEMSETTALDKILELLNSTALPSLAKIAASIGKVIDFLDKCRKDKKIKEHKREVKEQIKTIKKTADSGKLGDLLDI